MNLRKIQTIWIPGTAGALDTIYQATRPLAPTQDYQVTMGVVRKDGWSQRNIYFADHVSARQISVIELRLLGHLEC